MLSELSLSAQKKTDEPRPLKAAAEPAVRKSHSQAATADSGEPKSGETKAEAKGEAAAKQVRSPQQAPPVSWPASCARIVPARADSKRRPGGRGAR